jgi:DNA-directed RNA polymerase, mitochondrial
MLDFIGDFSPMLAHLNRDAKNTVFDRSVERIARQETSRAEIDGFGGTRQGNAIRKRYHGQLVSIIRAAKVPRPIQVALRGIKRTADEWADRLLFAGIVSGYSYEGEKKFRDSADRIGKALRFRGEMAIRVGAFGIELLRQLPIFTLDERGVLVLVLTEELDQMLNAVLFNAAAANPLMMPMLDEPLPWTQVDKGIVPEDHWIKPKLIDRSPRHERVIRNAIGAGRMDGVLAAASELGAVSLTINPYILRLHERTPAPEVPEPLDTEASWRDRQRWHAAKELARQWRWDLRVAQAFADVSFRLSHYLDFRGRAYPSSHFSHHREDRNRALFLIANGRRIGEDGTLSLKSHVAGKADGCAWSDDKKPSRLNSEKRLAWVERWHDRLCAIGRAVRDGTPLAPDDLPPKGDDRFQFAAACCELVQALEVGPDFITHLPITADGSVSGLQHLAAMTRSEVEGAYVNLTPSEDGDDFYLRVAEEVWFKHRPPIMLGPDDRKIVKAPSCRHFYGSKHGGFAKNGKPYGMTKAVCEVLDDEPFASHEGADLLAEAVEKAIETLAPCAKGVREFLEALVREYAKYGMEFRWTTPLGLHVLNSYFKPKKKKIAVVVNGKKRYPRIIDGDDTDKPRKKKAVQAVSPNFVHSVDACHMQMVVLAAAAEGIPLMVVHDCFSTIAPYAGRLKQIINEQFIKLHEHDLLGDILKRAKRDLPKSAVLPELPKRGSLVINPNFHAFK